VKPLTSAEPYKAAAAAKDEEHKPAYVKPAEPKPVYKEEPKVE
jgi:hypothetical protein